LLGSALIVIFSLLGAVVGGLDAFIQGLAGNDPNAFILNFKLSEIANWLRSTLQTPSLQAVRFGIGIGALTMGLRLWLSIEKSEGN